MLKIIKYAYIRKVDRGCVACPAIKSFICFEKQCIF